MGFVDPSTATTVSCQLDGGASVPCTSPYSWTDLADGLHTLTVTAGDALGNSSTTSVSWTIDATAPVVAMIQPTTPTNLRSGSTAFTAGDATTVSCRLDGGAAAACTSPFAWSDLADGLHTLTVTAADALDNSSSASVSWTIDATALPIVTIDTAAATTGGIVTATIAYGPGLTGDWVGLYATGGSTLLDWKYLNGSRTAPATGLVNAAVPFTMPITPGTCLVRFCSGSTLLSTSAPITRGRRDADREHDIGDGWRRGDGHHRQRAEQRDRLGRRLCDR